MRKGESAETGPDTKAILKCALGKKALSNFDLYLQNYLEIHDRFTFHAMTKLNVRVKQGGFLEDSTHFYVLSDQGFCVYELTMEDGHLNTIFSMEGDDIKGAAQHPSNKYCFVLSFENKIVLMDTSNELQQQTLVMPNLVAAQFTHDGTRIVAITDNGFMHIINVEDGFTQHANIFEEVGGQMMLFVHQHEAAVMIIMNDQLAFVSLEETPKIRTLALDDTPTCAAFMPGSLYGAAVAFKDGTISLYSFKTGEKTVHQKLMSSEITSLSFCPTRVGALAFACDSVVYFASLPQWGFGAFRINREYEMHRSPVQKIAWSDDNGELSMASFDEDMVHVFHVPDEYLPVYEPSE